MKKLNITTGGFPVLGEYLLHLQSGVIEAIKGLASNLPDGSILSGCAITNSGGTNFTCSEGFIKWKGEIFHVPTHSLVIAGANVAVAYIVPTNTAVPVEYQNGELPAITINYEVKFKGASAAGAGEILFSNLTTEHYLPGAWFGINDYNPIQNLDEAYFVADWSNDGGNARYRVVGDFLEFDGTCYKSVGVASPLILTLPIWARVNAEKWVPVALDVNDDFPDAYIGGANLKILTNGQVRLVTAFTTAHNLSFSGIRVRIK